MMTGGFQPGGIFLGDAALDVFFRLQPIINNKAWLGGLSWSRSPPRKSSCCYNNRYFQFRSPTKKQTRLLQKWGGFIALFL